MHHLFDAALFRWPPRSRRPCDGYSLNCCLCGVLITFHQPRLPHIPANTSYSASNAVDVYNLRPFATNVPLKGNDAYPIYHTYADNWWLLLCLQAILPLVCPASYSRPLRVSSWCSYPIVPFWQHRRRTRVAVVSPPSLRLFSVCTPGFYPIKFNGGCEKIL